MARIDEFSYNLQKTTMTYRSLICKGIKIPQIQIPMPGRTIDISKQTGQHIISQMFHTLLTLHPL